MIKGEMETLQQQQKQIATILRLRDEELQYLRKKITQLSSSNNILPFADSSSVDLRYKLCYKLKPHTFDGGSFFTRVFISI